MIPKQVGKSSPGGRMIDSCGEASTCGARVERRLEFDMTDCSKRRALHVSVQQSVVLVLAGGGFLRVWGGRWDGAKTVLSQENDAGSLFIRWLLLRTK